MTTTSKTVLLAALAGLAVTTSAAFAQTLNTPAPSTQAPITILPECAPEAADKPAHCDSLSQQLNETGGVIRPPATMDGGIYAPAPDPMPGTTPVIPPSALPDDPATGGINEGTAEPQ